MKSNKKFILLSIIGVIAVIIATFAITYAFMRPREENQNETNIDIKACAKIVFKETDSTIINMENTYPMDDEKGLETKPYEFDISSTCDEYIGFNLYLTSLASSELNDENIHYAITNSSGIVLASNILTSTADDGASDFDEEELDQLGRGIKGEVRSIHKVFNDNITKLATAYYKLYLWVDKNVEASETMNKSFSVGVSVKSYKREETAAEKLIAGASADGTLYYHDENLTGGAEDLSYRFAGASDVVKNFVCLDGNAKGEGACGNGDDDLYRIIGLFKNEDGAYEMKLIKYDYTTTTQLGTSGAFHRMYSEGSYPYADYGSYYKGTEERYNSIAGYYWTYEGYLINEWADSELRTINLNDYYLNTYLKTEKGINTDKLIVTHTWQLNGNGNYRVTSKEMFDNEMAKVESEQEFPIVTPTVNNKIGLMYVSDFGYAATPSSTSNYTTILNSYNNKTIQDNNWMQMGLMEWTISRGYNSRGTAFFIRYDGHIGVSSVNDGSSAITAFAVRPTFYLSAKVQFKDDSGDGSYTNPYRLVIE